DRSDRHVHIDVRGTIEWVEEQAVLAATEVRRDVYDARLFLRRHGAKASPVIHRLDDDLVGENVELLLRLALNVLEIRGTQDVGQAGTAHLVGDHLGGKRQVVKHAGELTRGFGMELLLLDDEALDCYDRCRSVLDHSEILVDGTEAG